MKWTKCYSPSPSSETSPTLLLDWKLKYWTLNTANSYSLPINIILVLTPTHPAEQSSKYDAEYHNKLQMVNIIISCRCWIAYINIWCIIPINETWWNGEKVYHNRWFLYLQISIIQQLRQYAISTYAIIPRHILWTPVKTIWYKTMTYTLTNWRKLKHYTSRRLRYTLFKRHLSLPWTELLPLWQVRQPPVDSQCLSMQSPSRSLAFPCDYYECSS